MGGCGGYEESGFLLQPHESAAGSVVLGHASTMTGVCFSSPPLFWAFTSGARFIFFLFSGAGQRQRHRKSHRTSSTRRQALKEHGRSSAPCKGAGLIAPPD